MRPGTDDRDRKTVNLLGENGVGVVGEVGKRVNIDLTPGA